MKWFDLLNPLSIAFDFGSKAPPGRARRVAYLAARLALEAGLGVYGARLLYFSGLLHDIGLIGPPDGGRAAFAKERHPIASAGWIKSLPLDPWVQVYVSQHHENWDGSGFPFGLRGREISLGGRILRLACAAVEEAERRDGADASRLGEESRIWAHRLAGAEFDPDVVAVYDRLLNRVDVVLDLFGPFYTIAASARRPAGDLGMGREEVMAVARLLGRLADNRRFRPGHAEMVARWSRRLGEAVGLNERDLFSLEVAAYVHDVGYLVLPEEEIRAASRSGAESPTCRTHPYFSQILLQGIQGLEAASLWAGQHHERLDGSGYPAGLSDQALPTGARILQVAHFLAEWQEGGTSPAPEAGESGNGLAAALNREAESGRLDAGLCRAALRICEGESGFRPGTVGAAFPAVQNGRRGVVAMKRMLFATDGSEASQKAQEMVKEFFYKWPETELVVLYVSQTVPYYYEATPDLLANLSEHEEAWARQIENNIREAIPDGHDRIRFKHLVGHPATAICEVAEEENVDLIIVGSHGRSAIDRMLLGSVSHGVLNRAKRPVLVVKG